jgi:hypothetical protein
MTVDIIVVHGPPPKEPPKERCKLCGLTLDKRFFAEMFLIMYDTPEKIVSKHEGIRICHNCHEKLLLEAGFLT